MPTMTSGDATELDDSLNGGVDALVTRLAGVAGQSLAHELLHDIERITGALEVVIDTAEHHRAAQARRARNNLFAGHPYRPFDAPIEAPQWVVAGDLSAEGRAQEAALLLGRLPEVNADQRLRFEGPGRLFQSFANDG